MIPPVLLGILTWGEAFLDLVDNPRVLPLLQASRGP